MTTDSSKENSHGISKSLYNREFIKDIADELNRGVEGGRGFRDGSAFNGTMSPNSERGSANTGVANHGRHVAELDLLA